MGPITKSLLFLYTEALLEINHSSVVFTLIDIQGGANDFVIASIILTCKSYLIFSYFCSPTLRKTTTFVYF